MVGDRFCILSVVVYCFYTTSEVLIIMTMYIYYALINALGAHIIHINLSTIFYTHADHSPTKTYIKYYMHARTHVRTHARTHAVLCLYWIFSMRASEEERSV